MMRCACEGSSSWEAAWKPPETTQAALADACFMFFCGNDGREHAMSRTGRRAGKASTAAVHGRQLRGGSKPRHEWASGSMNTASARSMRRGIVGLHTCSRAVAVARGRRGVKERLTELGL